MSGEKTSFIIVIDQHGVATRRKCIVGLWKKN